MRLTKRWATAILAVMLTLAMEMSVSFAANTDAPAAPQKEAAALPLPQIKEGKVYAAIAAEEGAPLYVLPDESAEINRTAEYGEELQITELGLGFCRVKSGESKLYVRTKLLSFSNEQETPLAIVHLKNSSKLPLHKEGKLSSKTLKKIPNGAYVVVLEKGAEFSRVLAQGKVGYLQNKYLSFRERWQEEANPGVLRDPNNAKKRTTVNLRSADSPNGKKIKALKTQTKITVLQMKDNKWAEIEVNGIHGYVMSQYISENAGTENKT